MIQKSEQQDIDQEGIRLLQEALGSLGWIVNRIEYDFGIDYDVQIFANSRPDGLWFKVQLKSSTHSEYSTDGAFVSQPLSVDHAKHYALELREPLFLFHADTRGKKVYWCAPQLDDELVRKLLGDTSASSITVRVPTSNSLPESAVQLLESIERLFIVLANRTLVNSTSASFADSLKHQPGEVKLREDFQRKNDILKLRRINELLVARQYADARSRARTVISDPDSSIENRFWAEQQIGNIDWGEAVTQNRPQSELPKIYLENAKALQALTKSGPSHLKLFAQIMRRAAELEQLAIDNWGLTILLLQHQGPAGSPLMALTVFADHVINTQRLLAKYNQCLRLVRYASKSSGRWVLPRALARIIQAAASFVARVDKIGLMEVDGTATQFQLSILEVSKLIAWIAEESGDQEALALATSTALLPVTSQDTDAFQWAIRTIDRISDPDAKKRATKLMERHMKRWKGEPVDGDVRPDPAQQLVENAAASLGIDLSNHDDPLVRGLRTAARDNTPERVLKTCEHILSSMGATGPIARRVELLLGIQTAGSKIIHCSLHNYHHEGKDLDSAFAAFKSKYCDTCPDRSPRPPDWRYTNAFQQQFNAKHLQFVKGFNATGLGYRFTDSD